MAVPKRKTSKARHRKRFANWNGNVEAVKVVRCRSCGGVRRPHVACPYCGNYKGEKVMEPRAKEID